MLFELQWFIMIIYKLNKNFRWTEDEVLKLQYTTYGVSLRPLPTSPLGRGFESAKEKVRQQRSKSANTRWLSTKVKVWRWRSNTTILPLPFTLLPSHCFLSVCWLHIIWWRYWSRHSLGFYWYACSWQCDGHRAY